MAKTAKPKQNVKTTKNSSAKLEKKTKKQAINIVDLKKTVSKLEKSPMAAFSTALNELAHPEKTIEVQLKKHQSEVKKLEADSKIAHKRRMAAENKANTSTAATHKNAAKKAKTLHIALNKNLQQTHKELHKTKSLYHYVKTVKNKMSSLAKAMNQLAKNWQETPNKAQKNKEKSSLLKPETAGI